MAKWYGFLNLILFIFMVSTLDEIELLVKKFFAVRSATNGKYSRYHKMYFYLSDVTGDFSIWVARFNGGRIIHDLLIPWESRIGDFRIGPHGHIAFMSDINGDEMWSIYLYRYSEGRIELVAGGDKSINNLGYWSPSGRYIAYVSNRRNRVDFDIYIYDIATGKSTMVAEGDGMINASRWIDDARFFIVKRNTNLDSDIGIVDIRSGEVKILTKHEDEALNESPIPLDRSMFIYISNHMRDFTGVFMYDLEKMESKLLIDEGWDIDNVDLVNGNIIYTVNRDGYSVLKMHNPISSKNETLFEAEGVIGGIDAYDGGVVISYNSPKHGMEIFDFRFPQMILERITYSPKIGLSEDMFIAPKLLTFKAKDGLTLKGFLYEPRNSRPPYPTLIYLHGGPESQERPIFNRVHQTLANLGIAVASPNFRGSSGYGKKFIHLDDVDKRLDAVSDVASFVDYLISEGISDGKRICVMGGSYGGYLTLMSIGVYPDMFSCAVEIVGIVNLVTFIRNTGPWRRKYRMVEYGDPEKHYDIMIKLSPISYVDNIRTPLMVIHGANDPRVPVSEAEQLIKALRDRGVEVRYIRLEDEGHGISKVSNRVKVYSEVIKFMMKYLKPSYS